MYDWETFQATYKSASKEQRAVVDSEVIGTCCRQVSEQYQLDLSVYQQLVKLYCLHTLGAIGESLLSSELQKLAVPDPQKTAAKIATCISTTPVTPSHHELAKDLAEVEAAFETESVSAVPPPPTNPSTPPAPDVPPKPTSDVVYSSTQSALLNDRSKPAASIPRWDSEQ